MSSGEVGKALSLRRSQPRKLRSDIRRFENGGQYAERICNACSRAWSILVLNKLPESGEA